MSEQQLIDIMQDAIRVVILASAPPLIIGLVVGLAVSIFQTVTSIQDATLAFVPKIIAIMFAILIFGPFMMAEILEYMRYLFMNLADFIR